MVYGLKPEVWGRVGPDPRAELQVGAGRGPQAQGLGRPSLCVALPEQANSHLSDASYHGEQGYNCLQNMKHMSRAPHKSKERSPGKKTKGIG